MNLSRLLKNFLSLKLLSLSRKALFATVLFTFLFIISCIYIINYKVPTLRGSLVTYKSNDQYSGQEKHEQGRIIALPGELIRFNLENDQIYLKQGNKAYKVIENYLPESSSTLSLSFTNGWHKLNTDEVLILSDNRSIQDMSDFVYEKNIIKKGQIVSTQRTGKKADISLQSIDEFKEFSLKVDKSWLGWQVQVSESINIKNNALPVASFNLLFVPTIGNKLVALDSSSGNKKWEISFSNTILKIIPNLQTRTISVSTLDNKTLVYDAYSGERIQESDSVTSPEPSDPQSVVKQDTHFKIEKQSAQIILMKTDDTGKVLWRHLSRDMKNFPDRFEKYGDYLVGMGSYGGNYMEDVPYKSSIYVINAHTGKLVALKDNLGYANFNVIEDILVIYDKDMQGYDLLTGKNLWLYPIKDDSGSNYKNWIIDQTNHIIYAADSKEIVALRKDGSVIWSKKIESVTRGLSLKNSTLYFLDQGKSVFYALDLTNGNTLWQVNTINGSEGPHITSQNQIFFKNLRNVKFQFTQTEFLTLDPLKMTPVKIFERITRSDNDILFYYEEQYVYVFTDDLITAIKYQPD